MNCNQTKNQSVLQHGFSVARYFSDLYKHLVLGESLKYQWRLPEGIYDPRIIQALKDCDLKKIYKYHIYHDCGKPFCVSYDEKGVHFKDHAKISFNVFNQIFDDKYIANLIKSDMDIHLLKSDGYKSFFERDESIILLLTGLSEVHSNAAMFGGIESDSFKIKWKKINKATKYFIKQH